MNEHARELPLAHIIDNPHQPRLTLNLEVVAGVKAAIATAGRYPIAMAITVRPLEGGVYEIIAGHHRARGAREMELETIWAHVEQLDDREAAIKLATTNNQAEMTAFEHARHALWLSEHHGVGINEYSRLVGKSRATVTTAIAAYRVLSEHGGPEGPNAAVPVGTLAALDGVDDPDKRAALLYQFRNRRSTTAQAEEVIAQLKAGRSMREAFDRAEGRTGVPKGPTVGKGTLANAGDGAALIAAHHNAELISAYEWTVALYQARSEELESRVGEMRGADLEAFLSGVAARQRRILRELRAAPEDHLVKPDTREVACASCEHGRKSSLSELGFTCAAGRELLCQPLTARKCWVSREEDEVRA